MKLTERRSNGKLTTWIYEDESLRSVEAAAGRIAYAAALEGFEPKYIALRDLEHSADEGSDSRELRADAGKDEILAALAAKSCDRLFLSGKYRDVRVGVTIDLKTFGLSITLPEERIDAMESLANSLDGDVRQQQAYWICCPICGKKTKTRVYEDTVLLKYPLYCTKCKKETIINVVKLKTVISDEPDD